MMDPDVVRWFGRPVSHGEEKSMGRQFAVSILAVAVESVGRNEWRGGLLSAGGRLRRQHAREPVENAAA